MIMSGPLTNISEPGIKAEGTLLATLRSEVAHLLQRKNTGFPGAQPVSFARRHITELTKQDYYVCEKSDGMRYLLYLTEDEHGGETQYLIDRKNDYWYVPKDALHFPIVRDQQGFHRNTIIDGELVMDKTRDGGTQPKFLVFDCLVLDENNLMVRTLDKRLAYFKQLVLEPYLELFNAYPEEKPFQHFLMEEKSFQFAYGIELMFKKILPELPHGNDGLIFTCRESEYQHGTDHHILKWKPESENSIDFRLCLDFPLIQPDEQDKAEGVTEPYHDYDAIPVCNLHVYAGGREEDPWYGTMYLEPLEWESFKSLKLPLNDRIVECFMDSQKRWRHLKWRDDKTTANHISTAESVIESIRDRVTEQDLMAAANDIRDAWKDRENKRRDADKRRAASLGVNANSGVKRKAEEQGNGRPSPGPPGQG